MSEFCGILVGWLILLVFCLDFGWFLIKVFHGRVFRGWVLCDNLGLVIWLV